MNRQLVLYFCGSKFQDFFSAAFTFGFLLIFYEKTGSTLYSGTLTAISIILSRIVEFFLIPLLKGRSPIQVASRFSLLLSLSAMLAVVGYSYWGETVLFYFVLSILFSTLQEMNRSFTNSIIPSLVQGDYLFKANSLNAILFNLVQISAPVAGFLFKVTSLNYLFLGHATICLLSSILMRVLHHRVPLSGTKTVKKAKGMSYFTEEWKATLQMIFSRNDLLFCILIGVFINMMFAGINGPFLLKVGGDDSGSTLVRVSLGVGSLLGVYGAFWLKVKENYQRYLQVSIYGMVGMLLLLAVVSGFPLLLAGMVLLTVFVMFLMNTTGTYLQMITPQGELPAVYAVRSSLYAVVVPLSYSVVGLILEVASYRVYLVGSALLILVIWFWQRKGNEPFTIPQKQGESA
ncbi:MAG TPA: hypothetical protein VFV52_12460 [Bacilli bacterium]|nr:hypothetical protein [Bacilli bacterium]